MYFALKFSSFALYVVFLTAILYGFAFNHAVLYVSCILLAFKVNAKMLQILQI